MGVKYSWEFSLKYEYPLCTAPDGFELTKLDRFLQGERKLMIYFLGTLGLFKIQVVLHSIFLGLKTHRNSNGSVILQKKLKVKFMVSKKVSQMIIKAI